MAKDLKLVCRKYGVPLIINDSIKIADQSGADGVQMCIRDSLYAFSHTPAESQISGNS